MLANYPIAATQHNWISVTLLNALRSALNEIRRGNAPPIFQDAIVEEHRAAFLRGQRFQHLYDVFAAECRKLTAEQCAQVINALNEQNNFPAVFTATEPCSSIKDTLPEVHEAAKNLFKHAFEKLSAWKAPEFDLTIRANYHHLVDAHLSHGSCPFCGYEPIEAADPDLVDPDLDHYLAVSIYPFAGVNLRNLTAMGANCNRSYKGAQNILMNEHNERIDCLDPYGDEHVALSLAGTVILPGEGKGPDWAVAFDPDQKSRNWRRIFKLETRLRATVLERHYKKWLIEFIEYVEDLGVDISTRDGASEGVRKFKRTCKYETFPTIGLLKASFFELIEAALSDPATSDRMHNFLIKTS